MKTFNTVSAILASMLMLIISVSGCKGVDKTLNGRWSSGDGESDSYIEYQDGDFEITVNGLSYIKGTYTTKGNTITITDTHYGNYPLIYWYGYSKERLGSKWYTIEELSLLTHTDDSDRDEYISDLTEPRTGAYSINGDTLTETWETWDGETTTSTRISRNTEITKPAKSSAVTHGSDSNQALVGRWSEIVSGDLIDLLSDGTGIFDRQSITWKIEGNRLYILAVSSFRESGSFEYKVSESVLVLTDNRRREIYVRR